MESIGKPFINSLPTTTTTSMIEAIASSSNEQRRLGFIARHLVRNAALKLHGQPAFTTAENAAGNAN